MENRIGLSSWNIVGEKVRLAYSDGSVIYVSREDFNDSFVYIVNVDKESVMRDFVILM